MCNNDHINHSNNTDVRTDVDMLDDHDLEQENSNPDDSMDVSNGNLEQTTTPQHHSSPITSPVSPESQVLDAPSESSPPINNTLDMDEDDFDNFFELLEKRRANRVSTGNEDLDQVLDEFSALFDAHIESTMETGEIEKEIADLNGTYEFGRFVIHSSSH